MDLKHQLLRPRHLIATALVTAILTGAFISTVSAEDEVPQQFEPFGTPNVRAGDKVQFSGVYGDTYEIGPSMAFYNGTHRMTVAALETVTESGTATFTGGELIELSGSDVVGYRSTYANTYATEGLYGLPIATEGENSDQVLHMIAANMHGIPCGISHPFQGTMVSLEADVPDDQRCDLWSNVAWRPTAEGFVDGKRQMLFTMMYAHHEVGRVVLQEDLAYPIEMTTMDGTVLRALVGFGQGPADFVQAPEPFTMPALEQVPRAVWGVDVNGVDMPVTAEDAYRIAMADEGGDLEAFMDSHPRAYAAVGWGGTWHTETQDQHWWSLIFTDGVEEMRVNVNRYIRQPAALGLTEPTRDVVDVDPVEPAHVVRADPSVVPTRAPSLESLVAAYEAFGLTDFDSYGFTIQCQTTECDQVWATASVGRSSGTNYRLSTAGTGGSEYVQDHLTFLFDGSYHGMSRRETSQTPIATPVEDPQTHTAAVEPTNTKGLDPVAVAVAGSFGVGLGVLFFAHPVIRTMFLALFSRIRTDRLLVNPQRRQIHEVVQENPGIHYQALRRQVEMPNGTFSHHLGKLSSGGVLTPVKAGGHTCYFVKGTTSRQHMAAAPVLKSKVAKAIVAHLQATPGARASDVRNALGISPSTLHYHMKRLQDADVIEVRKAGNGNVMELTRTGHTAAS